MINKFGERVYEDLNRDLTAIKMDEQQLFKGLEQSILTCIKSLDRLKAFFKEHQPKSLEEEITFFKEIKPKFKSLLLFYQQLLNIESRKPIGDREMIADYYLKELKILTHFFESNISFYQYIRSGASHLDSRFFVRGEYDIHLEPHEGLIDADTLFNTSHDSKLAQVLAHELLITCLEKKILAIHHNHHVDLKSLLEEERIVWTQTNTALIELIYGWKETKAINDGKLSIERIVRYMEKVLHVKLDNCYDTWSYICQRANKTIYVDEMKMSLLEKIAQKSR